MTKYFIKGGGEITLTQREFIAQGGEGSIYGKGNKAYKIYEDSRKMIPLAKIDELSKLDHKNIIKPELVILDKNNNPIGYTMQLLNNTYSLCQIFTKAFKKRNNLSNDNVLKLVKEFQNLIKFIHKKNVLVVDLNEFNFLSDDKFKNVYAIDVNSYQTPSFPATAIMESIRDRHNNKFTELTDWFSWAIVSFQLITGIHPYKGKHDKYNHLKGEDRLNQRMIDNVSVFHNGVRVPAVIEPFDIIPKVLRDWYKAVLEEGKRLLPPEDYEAVANIVQKITKIESGKLLEISLMCKEEKEIKYFVYNSGVDVICTDTYVKINKKKLDIKDVEKVFFTPRLNLPIGINKDKQFIDLNKNEIISFATRIDNIIQYDGRVYVTNNSSVLEIEILENPNKLQIMTKMVGSILDIPGATKAFDGVVLQNVLGRCHASIFPTQGKSYQVSIPELDHYKVIEAKFENNVLVIIGTKKGIYDRFVFVFEENYKSYELRKVENISYMGINFTVGDQGICVLLNEEEKLEIFRNRTNSSQLKILDDPSIRSDMRLYHKGVNILFVTGNELHQIKMK